MKKRNEWFKILGENEVFLILYKMRPSKIHDSAPFKSYINQKLVYIYTYIYVFEILE